MKYFTSISATEKVWESDSTDASETEAPVKVAPPTVTTKQQPKKPADKVRENYFHLSTRVTDNRNYNIEIK